ncbi:hypothetical protein [Alkalibacillus almallahensis]|uniref:hypothetical protein n=1 Tax=Alkalibacillus almallahensis TaxID=1379154 RepID=UPI0014217012|nr:hypothetical protein [Alkalibacillus almallahensis]NIK12887.1 hypothetical protein [Alkalibacillus almallahensis]
MIGSEIFDSLKPQIDTAKVSGYRFANKEARFKGERTKLEPSKKTEVKPFNEFSFKSKYNSDLEFTNFYREDTDQKLKKRINELSEDFSVTLKGETRGVEFDKDRIKEILELFVGEFHEDDLSEDEIVKVRLYDPFGYPTEIRVYLTLDTSDLDNKVYYVLMVDLFHLVIPSSHNGKQSEVVKQETFEHNKDNNKCISEFFAFK